jgi:hypothetical protein
MKSRLMNTLSDKDKEAVLNHTDKLIGLDEGVYAECLHILADVAGKGRGATDEDFLDISNKTGTPVADCISALTLVANLYLNEKRYNDSIALVLEDIKEIKNLDSAIVDSINRKIEAAKDIIPEALEALFEEPKALRATLPDLIYLGHKCVLTGEFSTDIKYQITKPEEYEPIFNKGVPLMLVQIDINFYGKTERFSFGLSEKDVDYFIDYFIAARKELKVFKEDIKR